MDNGLESSPLSGVLKTAKAESVCGFAFAIVAGKNKSQSWDIPSKKARLHHAGAIAKKLQETWGETKKLMA